MTYVSLIENIDLVQGDSSPVWFIGLPDVSVLDLNWTGRYVITTKFGAAPIVTKTLSKNTGIGSGDTFAANTKFVFQIFPVDSALLVTAKYDCAVELTNNAINYKGEVARFKINVLTGV